MLIAVRTYIISHMCGLIIADILHGLRHIIGVVIHQVYETVLRGVVAGEEVNVLSVLAPVDDLFPVITQEITVITGIRFGRVVGVDSAAVIGEGDYPRFIPWGGFRVAVHHYIVQHLAGQVTCPKDSVVIAF